MTTFPFGKYKGLPIDKIPTDYLLWAKKIAHTTLLAAIEYELNKRSYGSAVSETKIPADLLPLYCEVIKQGYRVLAQKLHPDAGGKTFEMQKLNHLKEILEVK